MSKDSFYLLAKFIVLICLLSVFLLITSTYLIMQKIGKLKVETNLESKEYLVKNNFFDDIFLINL